MANSYFDRITTFAKGMTARSTLENSEFDAILVGFDRVEADMAVAIGTFNDRGDYDASVNTFPATGGSGTAGAIMRGDWWFVSVPGTLGGELVGIGDSIRALANTPGQTAGNWGIIHHAESSGYRWGGTAGGMVNAITITTTLTTADHVPGLAYQFITSGANTTAVTFAPNGLSAKALVKNGNVALGAGDLPAGALVTATYDGTNYHIANIVGLLDSDKASQAQAQAGTASTVWMTPERVSQYVSYILSSQDQAIAGESNTTLMTPLRTAQYVNLKSPLNFGGVGNGIVDDTSAITDCIDEMSYLFLPPGFTFLSSGHVINFYKFKCFGGGILKLKDGSNATLLDLDEAAYSKIEDVELDGNKANQTVAHPLLVLRNSAYTQVLDSYIHDSKGDGLLIENKDASAMADEKNIINNRIFSNDRYGLRLDYTNTTHTVTITIANPGVISWTAHNLVANQPIMFTTTGALPTGITASNYYYVKTDTIDTFKISATPGGADIETTGTQSGVHTCATAIQGVGDTIVSLNHINYNGLSGVIQRGGSSNIYTGNNILTNSGHGLELVSVPGEVAVTRAIINAANQIRNNAGSGVAIHNEGWVSGSYATDITVEGNCCHYNGSGASNIDIWDVVRPIVSGNYAGDVDFTPRSSYGMQMNRCTRPTITGNNFDPDHNVYGGAIVLDSTGVKSSGNTGLLDIDDITTTEIDATGGGTVDILYADGYGSRLAQVINLDDTAVTFTFSGWPTGGGEQKITLDFTTTIPTITWPTSITGAPDLSSVPSGGQCKIVVDYSNGGYWIMLAAVSS